MLGVFVFRVCFEDVLRTWGWKPTQTNTVFTILLQSFNRKIHAL